MPYWIFSSEAEARHAFKRAHPLIPGEEETFYHNECFVDLRLVLLAAPLGSRRPAPVLESQFRRQDLPPTASNGTAA